MLVNKYFSIKSISGNEPGKILFTIAGILIIGLIFVISTPLEYLFMLMGIKSANGCPLLTFTSIPCPFCGMGTLFNDLFKLDFTHLFYHNPLGLIFYIILGIIIGSIMFLAFTKRKIVFTKSGYKLIWLPAGFMLLMWILNILYGHHP